MVVMKCRVCNYEGEAGSISFQSSNGDEFLCGRLPEPIGYVGAVEIDVCPNCGVLSSNMNCRIYGF
jgi:hypothetical protein